uniref:Uncharacterized protein n=1 Tax=Daucus carota subsp. sativus TaxID=79200 RepID=A0A166GG27_DAUCS
MEWVLRPKEDNEIYAPKECPNYTDSDMFTIKLFYGGVLESIQNAMLELPRSDFEMGLNDLSSDAKIMEMAEIVGFMPPKLVYIYSVTQNPIVSCTPDGQVTQEFHPSQEFNTESQFEECAIQFYMAADKYFGEGGDNQAQEGADHSGEEGAANNSREGADNNVEEGAGNQSRSGIDKNVQEDFHQNEEEVIDEDGYSDSEDEDYEARDEDSESSQGGVFRPKKATTTRNTPLGIQPEDFGDGRNAPVTSLRKLEAAKKARQDNRNKFTEKAAWKI